MIDPEYLLGQDIGHRFTIRRAYRVRLATGLLGCWPPWLTFTDQRPVRLLGEVPLRALFRLTLQTPSEFNPALDAIPT